MANLMNYLNNDCIVIDDDDDIENTHNTKYNSDKPAEEEEVVEIVFESASTRVLNNNNNDHNHRKRPYSALSDGGIVINSIKIPLIDLTQDNEEIDHNVKFRQKVVKHYPSLCVNIFNGLCSYHWQSNDEKRKKQKCLDEKLKDVLLSSLGTLEVWLIKKSLIFQDHYCDIHRNTDGTKVKLKLVQNASSSNDSIFKWHRSCCSIDESSVSLYYKSFFDNYPSAKFVLNMIYHWICLSKPTEIFRILDVSLECMSKFFFRIRAVCTAAIHEKFDRLGGPNRKVEFCLMYVGVRENSSSTKKLKVIIAGVMDTISKIKIILALPPTGDYRNRDSTSLAPLTRFVHPESIIVTDQSISKNLLTNVGFQNVFCSLYKKDVQDSNGNILKFSRNALHMFEPSLTSLSLEQIQLCLNELLWREKWGTHSLDAFNALLAHISELTKLAENFNVQRSLHSVLDEIINNPNKCCNYSALAKKQVSQSFKSKISVLHSPAISTDTSRDASLSILEPYYYGTYPGDKQILATEIKRCTPLSCHLCNAVFVDNYQLIEHLVKHALSKNSFDKIEACTICLKSFCNKQKLINHLAAVHRRKPSDTACLICDEDFSDRSKLLEHMKNTHTELDLPYRCGICHYMCSERRLLTEHLCKFHNRSSCLWCPMCFKIFMLENEHNFFSNLNKFSKHIARHLHRPFVEKCSKCSLHFLHDIVVKEHLEKDHISCKMKLGVSRYSSLSAQINPKINRERNQTSSVASNSNRLIKSISKMYYSEKVKKVHTFYLTADLECIECEGSLMFHKFISQYHCKKCAYSTLCRQAINYHIMDYHIKGYSKPLVVRYEENSHVCVCGYFSKNGNKFARHLTSCKSKLLEVCSENVVNNYIVSSVILNKSVGIFQVGETPDVLLSVGLVKR